MGKIACLPLAACRLPLAACRLPLAACRLPLAACRLPPAAYRLSPAVRRGTPAARRSHPGAGRRTIAHRARRAGTLAGIPAYRHARARHSVFHHVKSARTRLSL
ncbi:peptide chain release factor 1 [Burkholderia mallei GB8 horse 4]|nr:peptide chain release factor 1 [Burkholderia mallei GB8 horse 4]